MPPNWDKQRPVPVPLIGWLVIVVVEYLPRTPSRLFQSLLSSSSLSFLHGQIASSSNSIYYSKSYLRFCPALFLSFGPFSSSPLPCSYGQEVFHDLHPSSPAYPNTYLIFTIHHINHPVPCLSLCPFSAARFPSSSTMARTKKKGPKQPKAQVHARLTDLLRST